MVALLAHIDNYREERFWSRLISQRLRVSGASIIICINVLETIYFYCPLLFVEIDLDLVVLLAMEPPRNESEAAACRTGRRSRLWLCD